MADSNSPFPALFMALLYGVAITLPTVILLTTTRKGSLLRYAYIPFLAYSGYQLFLVSPYITESSVYKVLIAGRTPFLCVIHFTNLLVLTGVKPDDLIQPTDLTTSLSIFSRLAAGYELLFNLRGFGTRWQVKNVPSFPAFFTRRGLPPARELFIIRNTAILAWQCLLTDLLHKLSLLRSPEEVVRVNGPGTEFLYLGATTEQWIGRIFSSLIGSFVAARIQVDIPYRLVSILVVALGISAPVDFPPLFGSMRDSYTLRNFWGKFWQQMMRWPFTSVSNLLCRDILRLPRPSFLERYTNILLVFVISGIAHVIGDNVMGIRPQDSGAMLYFPSFAFGIMVEDGIQAVWRQISGKSQINSASVPLWREIVGFIWVATFLSLVSPWYFYPSQRLPQNDRWIVPISVVDYIGIRAASGALAVGVPILSYFFGAEI